MDTRHRPLPVTPESVNEVMAERAAVRGEDGSDEFGEYLVSHSDEFVARFKAAQQALASGDDDAIHRLGDTARQSEAEAIVANFPS